MTSGARDRDAAESSRAPDPAAVLAAPVRDAAESPPRAVGFDVLLVPVGVGSLAAAAARFGAACGVRVIGVEPETAACLTASLSAGEPTAVPTPGTAMAGMDCAEVSRGARPPLRAGVAPTVTLADAALPAASATLARAGVRAGECGAAPLAALAHLGLPPGDRVVLLCTEGPTGAPPHPA